VLSIGGVSVISSSISRRAARVFGFCTCSREFSVMWVSVSGVMGFWTRVFLGVVVRFWTVRVLLFGVEV